MNIKKVFTFALAGALSISMQAVAVHQTKAQQASLRKIHH